MNCENQYWKLFVRETVLNENHNSSNIYVSLCTITYNRRPFIPMLLQCIENQQIDFHTQNIEWCIFDDGSDPILDLIQSWNWTGQIRYFSYPEKLTIGQKRKWLNDHSHGQIIIIMDDDDFYPSNRISHSISMLTSNTSIEIAGCSTMYIADIHNNRFIQYGPLPNFHITAASMAYKRSILQHTNFDESSSIAEEAEFLKQYQIPILLLDPLQTLLVVAHSQNSIEKIQWIENNLNYCQQNPEFQPKTQIYSYDLWVTYITNSNVRDSVQSFYYLHLPLQLQNYEKGNISLKQDIILQCEIKKLKKQICLLKDLNQKYIDYIQNNIKK